MDQVARLLKDAISNDPMMSTAAINADGARNRLVWLSPPLALDHQGRPLSTKAKQAVLFSPSAPERGDKFSVAGVAYAIAENPVADAVEGGWQVVLEQC